MRHKGRARVTIEAVDSVEPMPWSSGQPPPERTYSTDAHDSPADCPCWVCGAAVPADGARYLGPWRQHPGCVAAAGHPAVALVQATRWTGSGSLSEEDARLLASRHRVWLFTETTTDPAAPTGTPQHLPWAHVDRPGLVQALATVPDLRAEAGLEPSACATGRCWACGVEVATGWTDYEHRWRDGTPAPLCGRCAEAFVRHGGESTQDRKWSPRSSRFGPWLLECLTDSPPMMTASQQNNGAPRPPEWLVPYAEARPGAGDGRPWSHLDPGLVEPFRWAVWTRYGGRYAPPEHRVEAQRRAAEEQAQRAVKQAQNSPQNGPQNGSGGAA